MRQSDPERGKSPWRRGVRHDQLVLVCPACQESGDWTADFQSCTRCASVHLIRRLGQVECLDCDLVQEESAPVLMSAPAPAGAPRGDSALAQEVGRALDRLLGRP